jgi:hypothetical protein
MSAVAAPTGALDPVYSLIEAHRTAHAAHLVALAEQNRLEGIGDPAAGWAVEAPCRAAMLAFNDVVFTAPTTFAGLVAWAAYLNEISEVDEWMLEEWGCRWL